jgi:hypothetical protein
LKITLAVAPVQMETTVNADQPGVSVEPENNLNSTVLDEQFIQTLPDNEDDMLAFLQALAGPAAGGAMGGQGGAQIYIDGFTGGRLPPRDAILQIRINQNPFSAESSTPGIGRIDIVTKPGRDSWRGTFSFYARNSALDARNGFALVKPDLNQDRYQFNLGGPLIAKKLLFLPERRAAFARRQQRHRRPHARRAVRRQRQRAKRQRLFRLAAGLSAQWQKHAERRL